MSSIHQRAVRAASFAALAALAWAVPNAATAQQAMPPPAPDLRVQVGCTDFPADGTNRVRCNVDVGNYGTAPSSAPTSFTVNRTGSSAGVTWHGALPGSTFPCTPGGNVSPIPLNVSCTNNIPLAISPNSGASGTSILGYTVAPGQTVRICVSATQGSTPTTRPDSNPGNNTNICGTYTRPPAGPGLTVTKNCNSVGPNRTVTCSVTVTNTSSTPTPVPMQLTDTLTGQPPGTIYVGAGGAPMSCSAAGPYNQPVTCNIQSAIPPNGGTANYIFSFRTTGPASFRNCVSVRRTANAAPVQGCAPIQIP